MSSSLSPLLNDDISTATSPPIPPPTTNTSTNSPSSVTFIALILIFSAVVLISVYLFLRYLSNLSQVTSTETPRGTLTQTYDQPNMHVAPLENSSSNSTLLQSLPIFEFGSVKGNLTEGDCAVCLSKFEVTDQLRLLPLCCHAFHAECIDTWIVSNQTCPLCRSSVFPSEDDVLDKIRKPGNQSFRIEIGSISRREEVMGGTQSYSLGSFEYIVNGNGYEVSMEARGVSDYKEPSIGVPVPEPRGEVLAAEVGGGGRGWMRDYFDVMALFSSRATSFRGSGRFFTGVVGGTGLLSRIWRLIVPERKSRRCFGGYLACSL